MKFESYRCETKLIEGGKYFFDVGAEIGELVEGGGGGIQEGSLSRKYGGSYTQMIRSTVPEKSDQHANAELSHTWMIMDLTYVWSCIKIRIEGRSTREKRRTGTGTKNYRKMEPAQP